MREKRTKVDWRIRDRNILSLVSIKVNNCILCNQVDHSTQFCPLQASTQQDMTISTNRAVTKQTNYVHVDRVDRQGCTGVFLTAKKSVAISTILRVDTGPYVIFYMPVINVELQAIQLLLAPVLDNIFTLLVQIQHKQQNLLLTKT